MSVPVGYGQRQRSPAPFQEARPPRPGAVLVVWMLIPALLAAAVLGGFVLYAAVKPTSAPKPAGGAGGGLAWGGTTLFTQAQVTSWLQGHGASYRTWAKRHPAGVVLIVHKSHHPAKRHRTR
jgi:hypothetical protein